MAPGPLLTLASTAIRDMPRVVEDIVKSMDNELERYVLSSAVVSHPNILLQSSVRATFLLPKEFEKWSNAVSARANCQYNMFSTSATHEIARRRAMLLGLYSSEEKLDLPHRISFTLSVMNTHYECSDDIWQKVCAEIFRLIYNPLSITQTRMLYDGYYLHLEKDERAAVDKAFPDITERFAAASVCVSSINELFTRWKPCFEAVLTEVGDRTCRCRSV